MKIDRNNENALKYFQLISQKLKEEPKFQSHDKIKLKNQRKYEKDCIFEN